MLPPKRTALFLNALSAGYPLLKQAAIDNYAVWWWQASSLTLPQSYRALVDDLAGLRAGTTILDQAEIKGRQWTARMRGPDTNSARAAVPHPPFSSESRSVPTDKSSDFSPQFTDSSLPDFTRDVITKCNMVTPALAAPKSSSGSIKTTVINPPIEATTKGDTNPEGRVRCILTSNGEKIMAPIPIKPMVQALAGLEVIAKVAPIQCDSIVKVPRVYKYRRDPFEDLEEDDAEFLPWIEAEHGPLVAEAGPTGLERDKIRSDIATSAPRKYRRDPFQALEEDDEEFLPWIEGCHGARSEQPGHFTL